MVVPYQATDRLQMRDLRGLLGSEQDRFMIRITDGSHTSEALIDTFYEIENTPPAVEILLPLALRGRVKPRFPWMRDD